MWANRLFATKIGLPKLAQRCAERRHLNRRQPPSSIFSDGYHGMRLELTSRDPGPSVKAWNDQVTLWDLSIQHGGIGPSGAVFAVWSS